MPRQALVKIWKASMLPPYWFRRQPLNQKTAKQIENDVKAILARVAKNGDSALFELTKKYDKAQLDSQNLRATPQEIKEAYDEVSENQVSTIKFIKDKVSDFEKNVLNQTGFETSRNGIKIRNVLRPIESVGCYVPGGQAAYPSTLVMTVIPAKVAGVSRIVVCSPPNAKGKVNSLVLVTANICGVDEIYKVGGAQAIAALAYGTKTIRPVKKIVGPGNKYVTLAKMIVSKDVAIDMPAGPSEILILADETANPQFIVLDMISQAEHGADSIAGLITTSKTVAAEVKNSLMKRMSVVNRAEIVEKSLEKRAFIITCQDMDKAVELANIFAPEHIEIMTHNADKVAEKITSAGLILLGAYSPVALSDYSSGANHVLPTGGFGHSYSGLSAFDFARRVCIVESSKEGLLGVASHVKVMTEAENLPNHYKAVEARLEK